MKKLSEHPHIPKFYPVIYSEDQNKYAWIREFIDGVSLHESLKRQAFEVEKTLDIIEDIASALDFFHQQKYIHRDIKPSNILISSVDQKCRVVDFDIAVPVDSPIPNQEEVPAGTTKYMAPEQFFKQPEVASDRYALGILTYVLLTKEFPFDDRNPEKIQHLKSSTQYTPIHKKLPGVPSAFSNVIAKMLSTNPSARYSTCARFVEELRNTKIIKSKPRFNLTVVKCYNRFSSCRAKNLVNHHY